MSTLMIITRATLMSLSPASHPIQLATPEQAKFQNPTKSSLEKKHNYVPLIVSPANVVMFNCQGAMY